MKAIRHSRRAAGESIIESCLAIGLMCLVFFGLFQVSRICAAREILNYAAARGARARTVGFNRWFVTKCVRAGAIANAGKMLQPQLDDNDDYLLNLVQTLKPGDLWDRTLREYPTSRQFDIESVRIPRYLGSRTWERAHYLLDYSDWNTITNDVSASPDFVHASVSQNYPLRIAFHRSYYASEFVGIEGDSHIESHYPLYLDDEGL